MYGKKFAFQNRLVWLVVGRKSYHFCFVLLCIRGQIQSTSPPPPPPGGAYVRRVFCVTILGGLYLEGLIFGFYGT